MRGVAVHGGCATMRMCTVPLCVCATMRVCTVSVCCGCATMRVCTVSLCGVHTLFFCMRISPCHFITVVRVFTPGGLCGVLHIYTAYLPRVWVTHCVDTEGAYPAKRVKLTLMWLCNTSHHFSSTSVRSLDNFSLFYCTCMSCSYFQGMERWRLAVLKWFCLLLKLSLTNSLSMVKY